MPTTFSSLSITNTHRTNSVQTGRGRAASTASRLGKEGSSDESWNKLQGVKSFDLGPHPADPHSTVLPASPTGTTFPLSQSPSSTSSHSGFASFPHGGANGYGILNGGAGPNACKETVTGQEIWVYGGSGGTFTFWRFLIKVPLADREMSVTYNVNNGQRMCFHVPGRQQNMRMAIHSVSKWDRISGNGR